MTSGILHVMKALSLGLLFGCVITASGQTSNSPLKPEADQEESGESILAREKFFYTRRAGGAGKVIPDDAYAQAVAQHKRLDKRQRALGVDAALPSWKSVNPRGLFYNRTGANYISGRTNSIAFDPADPTIIYAAAAGGGVWRSTDDGANWTVLTDSLSSLACGAIATDPLTPDIVYLGTGELNYSNDSYYGDGLFKTTDGGTTWTKLFDTFIGRYFSQIVVNYSNPDIVYVASDVNVYKSTNAGLNWSNTRCGSLVNCLIMDPANTQVLYASLGGTGTNSIKKSTDGGTTWSTLTNGLPTTSMGRTQLAIARTNSNIIYASIANRVNNSLLGLYRTTDGGANWSLRANTPNYLGSQGWYDNALTVSLFDPNFVVVGGVDIYASTDGGVTLMNKTQWSTSNPNAFSHADIHFLGYSINSGDLYCGSDGGVYRSTNDGTTWRDLNTTISTLQYQSADYDPINPLKLYGGTQDNNIERSVDGGTNWTQYTTGDGGYTIVDPVSTNIVYSQYVNGSLERSEDGGIGFAEISPDGGTGGLFYNPYEMAPGDHNVIVFGQSNVLKTTSATTATSGSGWTQISGSVGANVAAIGISSTDANKIYIGTDNGKILTTTNNGSSWSTSITGLPYVSDLVVDPSSDAVCYASVGGFSASVHVLKTTNSGATWNNLSAGMPNIPVNTISLRSTLPRMLFIGTDLGVYRSTDDGATWSSFNRSLPAVAVFDLKYKEGKKLLLAATHGRGCFTYDLSGFSFGASPTNLAFGNVILGSGKLDSITVTNTGTTTLNISSVTSGSTKFVVAPSSGSINPSASKKFYVTYTATSIVTDTAVLTFNHDGVTSPDIIPARGDGIAAVFSVVPANLDIATTLIGLTRTDSVIVSNSGGATLNISSVTSTNSQITALPSTAAILPSGSQTFYLQYHPTAPGPATGEIVFQHDGLTTPDTVLISTAGGVATVQLFKLDDLDGNLSTTGDRLPKKWHFAIYQDSISASSLSGRGDSTIVTIFVPSAGTYIVHEADSGLSWGRMNGNRSGYDTLSILTGTTRIDTFINRRYSTAISVLDRWNMVSLPVIVSDSNAYALFPDATSLAYRYTSSYQVSLNFWKGVGYWLKFTAPHSYIYSGQPLESLTIDVRAGWNLIGALAATVLTTSVLQMPSGIVTSKYFRYQQGYSITDTLFPGKAYWVKTSQSGQLMLTSGGIVQPLTAEKSDFGFSTRLHELAITDGQGVRQSLYVGDARTVRDVFHAFELPPGAPQGVTDVRFASNRMIEACDEKIDHHFLISISSSAYPIAFEWKSAETHSGRFSLSWMGSSGRVQMPLRDRAKILIQDSSASDFSLNFDSDVPLPNHFYLGQNYPNPFNPMTDIRYQIAERSHVTLEIYNVLGQEVARLVDEMQDAGFKSVGWDGAKFSSGLYFYKLTAGDFTGVRKMILLK